MDSSQFYKSSFHQNVINSKFNVLEDKSALYGIYNPFWYLFGGIPLILLFGFPFFLIGVYKDIKERRNLLEPLGLIVFEVLFLSTNPHKEDRFLMKLFPFLLMFVGIGLSHFNYKYHKAIKKSKLILLFVFVFGNIIYFEYAALLDKRGAIDSMDYLRQNIDSVKSLELLTECHRTPFYSYLHR
jgi:phosphatidylinositol glycan class B